MARVKQAKATKVTKATKAKKPAEAPVEAPVEAPTEATPAPLEPVRLTAQDRETVAVSVLDLTLLELQRRLRDNPGAVQASGIAEVTKLLGLFWRFKDKLGAGEQDQAELHAMLADLPSYPAYTDEHDPMLQGNNHSDERPEAPVVDPATIARLASFDHN